MGSPPQLVGVLQSLLFAHNCAHRYTSLDTQSPLCMQAHISLHILHLYLHCQHLFYPMAIGLRAARGPPSIRSLPLVSQNPPGPWLGLPILSLSLCTGLNTHGTADLVLRQAFRNLVLSAKPLCVGQVCTLFQCPHPCQPSSLTFPQGSML